MTVYVDQMWRPEGMMPGCSYGGSCHLLTDGPPKELHRFAKRLRLRREWYQGGKEQDWKNHYEITASCSPAGRRDGRGGVGP